MKLKLVSAAVLTAFAAAPAFALLPGAQNANTTSLKISGATAQNNQIINYMRRICVPGSLDLYRRTGNNYLFFCNPVAALGLPGNLIVMKDGDGGSGNGVQPVADASTTLSFMDIGTLNTSTQCLVSSTVAAVTVSGDTLGLPAYTNWSCASHTEVQSLTEAGVSDVEPALFGASAAQLANLVATSTNALMFGVPVTTVLRNALQTAQIAAGTLPAACTAGNDSLECMPNLTKSQVTGLYTGTITDWTILDASLTPPAADPSVYVVRRVPTSGSQTSARVWFLNDPCAPGMAGFVDSGTTALTGDPTAACDGATNAPLGQTTFNMNGSGDVNTCMATLNTDGRWAVGVLSTENVNAGHRFVKLDGQAPTVFDTAKNRYQYVMEATIQRRPSGLTANQLAVFNNMASGLQDPAVLQAINTGFAHTFCTTNGPTVTAPGAGCTGLLTTALNGIFTPPAAPFTAAQIIDNPVHTATKSAAGAPVNCQPWQPAFPH